MNFTEELNDKQREAVLHTEGPLLILAGAGSGKTRVITNRIAYMIREKCVSPSSILAITFTNKAASEMRERVSSMIGADASGAWICTFHSACVRILRRYAHHLGYENNFSIYDADDSKSLIKSICKDFNIDTKRFKEKMLLSRISAAKDELISPENYSGADVSEYYEETVRKVYFDYQSRLRKNNAMDFDDLIANTVKLLRTRPDVLQSLEERFRFISIDEYQDTNTAQFELARLLASKYGNICVVGDDDQSIYRFRGANIENILSFEKAFPGACVIRLEQNYRSTKNILGAANSVIKHNVKRKEKSLWTENETGEKIHLFFSDNPYVEAEVVTKQIKRFLGGGFARRDIACLYRTNAQSRALEEAFLKANIPYKIVGGVNFYQRKEIKDILAYLKTIDNPRDDMAVRRIINVPRRGIGSAAQGQVHSLAAERGISFYSALCSGEDEGLFGRAGEKIRQFRNIIDYLAACAPDMTVKELIDELLERTGYVRDLAAEDTDESKARIGNVEELLNKAALFDESSEKPSLGAFLEEVSLIADIDSWDAAEDYVSLITVHSAKGLEFPVVFLCGMEDGLFPMKGAVCSDDPDDLEEERRLAYVAITRAKRYLLITAARSRMVRGETISAELSRFIGEMPPLLLEYDKSNVYVPKPKTVEARPAKKDYLRSKPYSSPETNRFSVNSGAEKPSYDVGDRVKHIKFGEGRVTAIENGGRDYEVTVDFDGFGTKKMFAAFANLKKI